MHLDQEKLLQHNIAQLFAKELDNAFIYTQLSKQSNLGLIRGELQRLHRMVNVSVHDYEEHPEALKDTNDPLLNSVSKINHEHKGTNASLTTNTTIARRPDTTATANVVVNSKTTTAKDDVDNKSSKLDNNGTASGAATDSSVRANDGTSEDLATKEITPHDIFMQDDHQVVKPTPSQLKAMSDGRSKANDVDAVSAPSLNARKLKTVGIDLYSINARLDKRAESEADLHNEHSHAASTTVAAASTTAAGSIAAANAVANKDMAAKMDEESMADASVEAALKQSAHIAEDGMTPLRKDGSNIPMDDEGIKKALKQAERNYSSVLHEIKQATDSASTLANSAAKALSETSLSVGQEVLARSTETESDAANASANDTAALSNTSGSNGISLSASDERLQMHLVAEALLRNATDHVVDVDTHVGREMLLRHFTELHRLGFEAFAINVDKPSEDLFLHDSHRYMLSELRRANNTTLFDYLSSHKGQKNDHFAVMYRDLSQTEYEEYIEAYNVFTDDPLHYSNPMIKSNSAYQICDEDENLFSIKQYADVLTAASALAKKQQAQTTKSESDEIHFTHKMLPDHHLTKKGDRTFEETIVHEKEVVTVRPDGRKAAYLVSVSPLGNTKNQQLVLISDITKLHKQEKVLKRLIAYTLNETVQYASQSTSLKIILMDSNYNSLAGNDMHDYLVSTISEAQLAEARENKITQSYDYTNNGYTTIRYFPQADWYVVVRGGDHHNFTYLLNYLLITGIAGLILCIIGLTIFLKRSKRDSSDLHTINTKIRHMAGLIQDSSLLQRITSELPQRNDEIGTLSGNVRLMTKTLYQYTQELKRISEHKVDFKLKMQQLARIKQESTEHYEKLKQSLPDNISLYSRVCDEYAGDFYDVYKLNDTTTAVIIGSVNRMGMSGWEAASVNLMLLRQLVELTSLNIMTLGQAVTMLNKQLSDKYAGRTLSSMCAFIVDSQTGKVSFINAGHNLAVITRKGQTFEYIAVRNGSVLGVNNKEVYSSYDFTMQDGDSLLLYTDGVLDCVNHRDQKLGSHGFESILIDETFSNASETVSSIKKKLEHFCHDIKQTNDCTVLCYTHKDTSKSLIDSI